MARQRYALTLSARCDYSRRSRTGTGWIKDVKYAVERGFFTTVANGYSFYFGDIVGAEPGAKPGTQIKGIETPDDQTIVFKLSKAVGGYLAAGALAML